MIEAHCASVISFAVACTDTIAVSARIMGAYLMTKAA
jgi:hypothetical protein